MKVKGNEGGGGCETDSRGERVAGDDEEKYEKKKRNRITKGSLTREYEKKGKEN